MLAKIVINDELISFFNENGKWHRPDGPAIENSSGDYAYYINGKLHRDDGPAYSLRKIDEWYLNGKKLTKEQHRKQTLKNIDTSDLFEW